MGGAIGNEGFDIVGLIEENDEYNQMVEGIKASFDAHFMEIIEYVQILEPHKALYLTNAELDVSEYADAPLEELRGAETYREKPKSLKVEQLSLIHI